MSRKWNSRSEQNLNLPLQSYSPLSPSIINNGLKPRNEMRDDFTVEPRYNDPRYNNKYAMSWQKLQ